MDFAKRRRWYRNVIEKNSTRVSAREGSSTARSLVSCGRRMGGSMRAAGPTPVSSGSHRWPPRLGVRAEHRTAPLRLRALQRNWLVVMERP